MTPADWHDIIVTVCVTGFVAVAALILGWALGWLEGSLSLRIVPPWKRRATEPRNRATASPGVAAGESPAAPVSLERRAS